MRNHTPAWSSGICHVGAGTPGGNFFRRYWIPALLSEEIPTPRCASVRVKLLDEDLIAFRDDAGRVGLIDDKCAHRRAPLFFGRNEGDGLRCIHHGWKYDVDGKILETPCEPANSAIRQRARTRPASPSRPSRIVSTRYSSQWVSSRSTHRGTIWRSFARL